MRPCISIRGSVRPLVRWSVRQSVGPSVTRFFFQTRETRVLNFGRQWVGKGRGANHFFQGINHFICGFFHFFTPKKKNPKGYDSGTNCLKRDNKIFLCFKIWGKDWNKTIFMQIINQFIFHGLCKSSVLPFYHYFIRSLKWKWIPNFLLPGNMSWLSNNP